MHNGNQPMNFPTQIAQHLVEELQVELSEEAQCQLNSAYAPGNWSPAVYLANLLQCNAVRDARHFLAHALPRRRALWWACLCTRDAREFIAERPLEEVLKIATQFVLAPSEELRRAAQRTMNGLPINSVSAHLASAVFMSTGSLSPPHEVPVPVTPCVLGRLVSVVIYAAATKKNIINYKHHMLEYIHLGQQIAAGEHLWPRAAAQPKEHRFDREHPFLANESIRAADVVSAHLQRSTGHA